MIRNMLCIQEQLYKNAKHVEKALKFISEHGDMGLLELEDKTCLISFYMGQFLKLKTSLGLSECDEVYWACIRSVSEFIKSQELALSRLIESFEKSVLPQSINDYVKNIKRNFELVCKITLSVMNVDSTLGSMEQILQLQSRSAAALRAKHLTDQNVPDEDFEEVSKNLIRLVAVVEAFSDFQFQNSLQSFTKFFSDISNALWTSVDLVMTLSDGIDRISSQIPNNVSSLRMSIFLKNINKIVKLRKFCHVTLTETSNQISVFNEKYLSSKMKADDRLVELLSSELSNYKVGFTAIFLENIDTARDYFETFPLKDFVSDCLDLKKTCEENHMTPLLNVIAEFGDELLDLAIRGFVGLLRQVTPQIILPHLEETYPDLLTPNSMISEPMILQHDWNVTLFEKKDMQTLRRILSTFPQDLQSILVSILDFCDLQIKAIVASNSQCGEQSIEHLLQDYAKLVADDSFWGYSICGAKIQEHIQEMHKDLMIYCFKDVSIEISKMSEFSCAFFSYLALSPTQSQTNQAYLNSVDEFKYVMLAFICSKFQKYTAAIREGFEDPRFPSVVTSFKCKYSLIVQICAFKHCTSNPIPDSFLLDKYFAYLQELDDWRILCENCELCLKKVLIAFKSFSEGVKTKLDNLASPSDIADNYLERAVQVLAKEIKVYAGASLTLEDIKNFSDSTQCRLEFPGIAVELDSVLTIVEVEDNIRFVIGQWKQVVTVKFLENAIIRYSNDSTDREKFFLRYK